MESHHFLHELRLCDPRAADSPASPAPVAPSQTPSNPSSPSLVGGASHVSEVEALLSFQREVLSGYHWAVIRDGFIREFVEVFETPSTGVEGAGGNSGNFYNNNNNGRGRGRGGGRGRDGDYAHAPPSEQQQQQQPKQWSSVLHEPKKFWRHCREALGKWVLAQKAREGRAAAAAAPTAPTAPLTGKSVCATATADSNNTAASYFFPHVTTASTSTTSTAPATTSTTNATSSTTFDAQLLRDLSLKCSPQYRNDTALQSAMARFVLEEFGLAQRCAAAHAAVEGSITALRQHCYFPSTTSTLSTSATAADNATSAASAVVSANEAAVVPTAAAAAVVAAPPSLPPRPKRQRDDDDDDAISIKNVVNEKASAAPPVVAPAAPTATPATTMPLNTPPPPPMVRPIVRVVTAEADKTSEGQRRIAGPVVTVSANPTAAAALFAWHFTVLYQHCQSNRYQYYYQQQPQESSPSSSPSVTPLLMLTPRLFNLITTAPHRRHFLQQQQQGGHGNDNGGNYHRQGSNHHHNHSSNANASSPPLPHLLCPEVLLPLAAYEKLALLFHLSGWEAHSNNSSSSSNNGPAATTTLTHTNGTNTTATSASSRGSACKRIADAAAVVIKRLTAHLYTLTASGSASAAAAALEVFRLRAAALVLRYEGSLATGSLQLCADEGLKDRALLGRNHQQQQTSTTSATMTATSTDSHSFDIVCDLCASPINAFCPPHRAYLEHYRRQQGGDEGSSETKTKKDPVSPAASVDGKEEEEKEEAEALLMMRRPVNFCSAFPDTDVWFGSLGSATTVNLQAYMDGAEKHRDEVISALSKTNISSSNNNSNHKKSSGGTRSAAMSFLFTLDVPYDEDLCNLLFLKLARECEEATPAPANAEDRQDGDKDNDNHNRYVSVSSASKNKKAFVLTAEEAAAATASASAAVLRPPEHPTAIDRRAAFLLVLPLWWDLRLQHTAKLTAAAAALADDDNSKNHSEDQQQQQQSSDPSVPQALPPTHPVARAISGAVSYMQDGVPVLYPWPSVLARSTWPSFDAVFVKDEYSYFCTATNRILAGVTATEVIGVEWPAAHQTAAPQGTAAPGSATLAAATPKLARLLHREYPRTMTIRY